MSLRVMPKNYQCSSQRQGRGLDFKANAIKNWPRGVCRPTSGLEGDSRPRSGLADYATGWEYTNNLTEVRAALGWVSVYYVLLCRCYDVCLLYAAQRCWRTGLWCCLEPDDDVEVPMTPAVAAPILVFTRGRPFGRPSTTTLPPPVPCPPGLSACSSASRPFSRSAWAAGTPDRRRRDI